MPKRKLDPEVDPFGGTGKRAKKKKWSVEVQLENGKVAAIHATSRPGWSKPTKRALNKLQPEFAAGLENVKSGFDRRHGIGLNMFKHERESEVIGKPLDEAYKALGGEGKASKVGLENLVKGKLSEDFNRVDNLRIGESAPNSNLGSLAGRLQPMIERGSANFQPTEINMDPFAGQQWRMKIGTYDELREMYWNSSYDFNFNNNKEKVVNQIKEFEEHFQSIFPKQGTKQNFPAPTLDPFKVGPL